MGKRLYYQAKNCLAIPSKQNKKLTLNWTKCREEFNLFKNLCQIIQDL